MNTHAFVLLAHLLAATVWTGGHLVLALGVLPGALRARDATPVQDFEARYERIGIPALLVQVVTGLWMAARAVPFARWLDHATPGAAWVTMKLALLALTAGLAVHARLRIVPTLRAETLPALAWHIAAITTTAVLFVVAGVGLRTGGFLV